MKRKSSPDSRPFSAQAKAMAAPRREPKLTGHQKREAIKRRDHDEETLTEIGLDDCAAGAMMIVARHQTFIDDFFCAIETLHNARQSILPESHFFELSLRRWQN
jgi:hypothetical protein